MRSPLVPLIVNEKKKNVFFGGGSPRELCFQAVRLPMTSTLLAISRAVDGVRERTNVPPHRIHRRASVGRLILALRRVPAELDRLQYCAGARPTIAIDLSQRAHVTAPISNNRQKRDDEYDGVERSIFL